MGKWQKYGLLLVVSLIGLLILYLVCLGSPSGTTKPDPSREQVSAEKLPEMEFSGTKLSEVVDEKVNWELNSQSIVMDREKNEIKFEKSKGVFFQEGKKALTLQGEKGFFDLESKDINLEGNVQAISDQGEKLQAQKIKWISSKQKIAGSGQVVFIRGNTKVSGDHFETDLGLENIQITGNVRVLIGGD